MANESDGAIEFYRRNALAWVADRNRPRTLMEKGWLDRFLTLVTPGGTVLDIGCGSGQPIAAYVMALGFDIVGIDSSPAMIDLCQKNFPNREWLSADMRKLALGRRFQGVMAWDSFFHLAYDDQRRMFPIFAAHAAPGAPLWFSSGPRHGEGIGELYGERLYHASLAPEEYRSLLATNGFSVIDYVPEDPTCGGHSIWLARREGASR